MPAQSNVSALRSVYHRIISLLLQEPSATDEEMAALFREKEEISRAIDPDHYANFVDTAALSIDAIKTELIKLNGRTGKLEDRLEKVEGRLDKVEGRLDKVEGRLAKVERRLEDLWDAFKVDPCEKCSPESTDIEHRILSEITMHLKPHGVATAECEVSTAGKTRTRS
eukprot:TRINITY_DN12632_c4_g1_i8.p4 TRINITY_DN12632_c4_g1~~TRINITY_DN12632_c4_g1_i8.p4  ORF type:complete len:168 (+),score=30.49 TRINITY_DN12632_c4_g1_i8:1758-2261(+)